MTKWYYAYRNWLNGEYVVKDIEVERETQKFLVLSDGKRHAKKNYFKAFFRTPQEAVRDMLERHLAKQKNLTQQLQRVTEDIERLEILMTEVGADANSN